MAGGNANRQRRIEGGNNSPRRERRKISHRSRGEGNRISTSFSPFLSLPQIAFQQKIARIIRGDCSLVNTRASEVKVQTPFDTTHFHPAREERGYLREE